MADTEPDRPERAPEREKPPADREVERETEREVERERPPPERDVERDRPPAEREVERERVVERERPADDRAAAREEAATDRRDALVWRVVQAVDYLFFLLYSLFLIRFVLGLLGAGEDAGFVRLIHALTDPFYAPFEGIVSRPALDGGYLDFPLALALVAFVFLHLAIRGLIRVIVGPRPAV